MPPPYWQYFVAIEDDLIKAARFVEFTASNRTTHSVEFARILLAASSEVDVAAKDLCRRIDPSSGADKIHMYRSVITGKFRLLPFTRIQIPRYDISLVPWLSWREDKTPNWWDSHNAVKHHRDQAFREANLENSLNATAALMVLLLHLYELIYGSGVDLQPPPQLLFPDEFQRSYDMQVVKSYWRLPHYVSESNWE